MEPTKIGIIRCEKNEGRCPLTSCLRCLDETKEGFLEYDAAKIVGVFTCRCPGDSLPELFTVLKNKGADVVHVVTCVFSHKTKDGWRLGRGFCEKADELFPAAVYKAGIPCVKGTAHLPPEYSPVRIEP